MPFSFVSEGFKFYANTFISFTLKTFPVFILIGFCTATGEVLLNDENFFSWGAIIFIFTNMFLNPFILVLSILLVNDLKSENLKETIGYYLVSFQLFFKAFLLTLVLSLITLVGLILFVIPGIYLASRLILAPFYLIIENTSITKALDRSWNVTKSNQIKFIYLVLFYWFILLVPYFLVLSIISAFIISEGAAQIPYLINISMNSLLSYFQMVILAYPLYFVFRGIKSFE